MEHDTSSLRLILRNAEQRASTAAALAFCEGPVNELNGELPFPVDGDTLTRMRVLTRKGRHGYYRAASDANASLYPIREALRATGAVA